jgi:hypothetical protein
VHVMKLPNPSSKMTILKIIILDDSEFEFKFKTVEESDFWQSATTPHGCSLLNGCNHYYGCQNGVYD